MSFDGQIVPEGERTILHSDMNCFYASVEMLYDPDLRARPMAVGGDPEQRHGIVLTANYIAKRRGVKTGMALWQARQACPDVVFVPPRMDLYLDFSRMAREIYSEYTDLQESFGIDECWLDVTHSCSLRGDGPRVARELNLRIRRELGVTVSVGCSWNKIYAKLGSDYKKPDAVTIFDRGNYRGLIYPLPVEDLLFVGHARTRQLRKYGILTIGQLAEADPELLLSAFGKVGLVLSIFARGEDRTPVSPQDSDIPIKSVGNSTTAPRDLVNEEDVKLVLYLLSESVASRLRGNGFVGDVISVYARDTDLFGYERQHRIPVPTNISGEIEAEALRLFRSMYRWEKPIRSLGVRVSDLKTADVPYQLDLFTDEEARGRHRAADIMVSDVRRRFGFDSIQRGIMYEDRYLSSLNAEEDIHMIHPHSYFERGNRTGI